MKNNQELKFSFWFSLVSLLSLSLSLSTSCILRDVDFDSLLSPLKLLNGWTFKKLTHTFDFIRHNKTTIFIIYTLTAKKYVKMNKTLQRKFLATHLGLSLNSRICIVASVNFKARWLNPIYFRNQGIYRLEKRTALLRHIDIGKTKGGSSWFNFDRAPLTINSVLICISLLFHLWYGRYLLCRSLS